MPSGIGVQRHQKSNLPFPARAPITGGNHAKNWRFFFVVTDWAGNAKCIVRTTSVKMMPYFSIHAEHARLEGEGDKSLAYWQKVHWEYYTRELAAFERRPLESMIIVFERFEKVFER